MTIKLIELLITNLQARSRFRLWWSRTNVHLGSMHFLFADEWGDGPLSLSFFQYFILSFTHFNRNLHVIATKSLNNARSWKETKHYFSHAKLPRKQTHAHECHKKCLDNKHKNFWIIGKLRGPGYWRFNIDWSAKDAIEHLEGGHASSFVRRCRSVNTSMNGQRRRGELEEMVLP